MIFSVSYELDKPGQDYDALYDAIKSAPSWCHALTSHWLIRTDESVQTWCDRLHRVMDANDSLFVVDITGQPRQGWLPQWAWDWLNQNEFKKASVY